MIIRPGQRIKLPDQKHNALSLSYLSQIVAVCNAILNLRVKGGQFFLGSNNSELQIEESTSATSNAVPGLPWQITEVDATTIQVSAGNVFVSGLPGRDVAVADRQIESTNTATDITVPASTVTPVWIKCFNSGSNWVAQVNVGTPPAGWIEYPAPQFFDSDWYTPYETAYVFIGTFDNTSSPSVITQELFDNPKILDFTSDRRLTAQAGVVDWDSGAAYRLGALVTWFGALYSRNSKTYGDSGNEPGTGSNDWIAIA